MIEVLRLQRLEVPGLHEGRPEVSWFSVCCC